VLTFVEVPAKPGRSPVTTLLASGISNVTLVAERPGFNQVAGSVRLFEAALAMETAFKQKIGSHR